MRLSIITINYNNKNGLQKTIDSVISQTFTDFEWIIIDGGSTDGSKELIEQYNDNISYWVSEPDKGIYNAMNKGIEVANGEYCLFLNSGDLFCNPDILDKVNACGWDADIISGQVLNMDNGNFMHYRYNDDTVKKLLLSTIDHQGAFIKRSLFDSYRYREDYEIVSDWIAWMHWLIRENYSIKYIKVIVAYQDMNGISHNGKNHCIIYRERQRGLEEIFGVRVKETLLRLYNEQEFMEWPIMKDIRFLAFNTHYLYSILIRVVNILMKISRLFNHNKLEKENI